MDLKIESLDLIYLYFDTKHISSLVKSVAVASKQRFTVASCCDLNFVFVTSLF